MKFGVLGYRNHAARMIRLLARRPDVESIRVYHPRMDAVSKTYFDGVAIPIDYTQDLGALTNLDGVIIASPNETHVPFIKQLIDHVGYVLCEKPPAVTPIDLQWLGSLDQGRRARILFNYNYARTALAQHFRSRLQDGAIGNFVYANFFSGHGLAFTPGYSANWRAGGKDVFSSILGNVGIHYIYLVLDLFHDVHIRAIEKCSLSGRGAIDTVVLMLGVEGGRGITIALTYASPYLHTGTVMFTDGFVVHNDGEVLEYAPRDHFDAAGRFARPPARMINQKNSSKEFYDAAISCVIDEFANVVKAKGTFSERLYRLALKSADVVLETERIRTQA